MTDKKKYKLGTLALHGGFDSDPTTGASTPPIYATSSFVFRDTDHAAALFALKEMGNIYSRLGNPTCGMLEQRLAEMDGGVGALAFASGMAAISAAVMTLTHSGQNFIAANTLYGGTVTLFTHTFKNFGVEVRYFDPDHPEQIAQMADENTRCVYIESIGNPKNNVPDFEKISAEAHKMGLPLLCDNTVTTPAMFRPFEHGIDIAVYSTTKLLGGHGLHVGGAVVDSGKFRWSDNPKKWPEFCAPSEAYHGVVFADAVGELAYIIQMRCQWLRDTGAAMSPFAAFLFMIGIETLHLRAERHAQNAQAVAEFLAGHECVAWVNYPGLKNHPHHANAKKYLPKGKGAIIGFGIKGGKAAGVKFINSVQLAKHLANILDAKTLVIHPASTTHQQLTAEEQQAAGVSEEYIRLSVGIEDITDIQADLDQALRASQKK